MAESFPDTERIKENPINPAVQNNNDDLLQYNLLNSEGRGGNFINLGDNENEDVIYQR
jgi:hypothetical protein